MTDLNDSFTAQNVFGKKARKARVQMLRPFGKLAPLGIMEAQLRGPLELFKHHSNVTMRDLSGALY